MWGHIWRKRIGVHPYCNNKYDFSDEDHRCVLILDNNIYEHTYLQINYTTYDLQQDQDSINPCSHPNVMLLSQEDECSHPYWYAHVCLVFHAMVLLRLAQVGMNIDLVAHPRVLESSLDKSVTVRSPDLLFSIIHFAPLMTDSLLTFTLATSFFTNVYRYMVQ